MKRHRWLLLSIGIGVLWVVGFTSAQDDRKCCYTHPSYSGTCEVIPGEGETCQSILEYLNSPMSQGKNYCGGTELRGGWELVSCGEK